MKRVNWWKILGGLAVLLNVSRWGWDQVVAADIRGGVNFHLTILLVIIVLILLIANWPWTKKVG